MPDSRWKLVSIRTLCEEGEPRRKSRSNLWSIFLSTPSARRATERPIRQALELSISIHALREEGDGAPHPAGARTQHFYPRPPRGGRRSRNSSFGKSKVFLSTPSARRATTRGLRRSCRGPISIHALREEGDAYTAECMEALKVFLSTPSARRATWRWLKLSWARHNFYPRPPRGGRRIIGYPPSLTSGISIHALREEGDAPCRSDRWAYRYFYPRPPRGGRPVTPSLTPFV